MVWFGAGLCGFQISIEMLSFVRRMTWRGSKIIKHLQKYPVTVPWFSPSPRSFIAQPKFCSWLWKGASHSSRSGVRLSLKSWDNTYQLDQKKMVWFRWLFPFPYHYVDFCLLVVEPTHLENMRKSNWIMKPHKSGVKHEKIFELPPPRILLLPVFFKPGLCLFLGVSVLIF